MRKTIFAIAAAATAVIGAPALAEPQSENVAYSDLDLSSPADIERLEVRVRAAVRQVCGEPRIRPIEARLQYQQCITDAEKFADLQVAYILDNRPALALRETESGK